MNRTKRETKSLGRNGCVGKDNIKKNIREYDGGCRLGISGSEKRQVGGSCREHYDKLTRSIK